MHLFSLKKANKHQFKIVTAFMAIYLIWGTTYLAIRVAVETIPPFLMAGSRFLIAGLLTFGFLRARGVPLPTRLQWRSAAIVGAFLMVGGNGLVTWSEQRIPSGMAALIVATMPLWMTLFDWLLYKSDRPNKRTVTGLLLGFIGIILLIGPDQLLGGTALYSFSLLLLLLAPILWSLGSLYSREAVLPENVFMSTAMQMLAGGMFLLLIGLITGEAARFQPAAFSLHSIAAMFYLTFFGSILVYTAYVWLLKHVPATRVATSTYVNPVIAVLLGWLLLDETITWQTVTAVVIIVVAVVLITVGRQKSKGRQAKSRLLTGNRETAVAGD